MALAPIAANGDRLATPPPRDKKERLVTSRSLQRRAAQVRASLPAPPEYLREVPDGVLSPGQRAAQKIERWCAARGVERPTLLDLAAERARRARLSGAVFGAG